jgi:hypothetical protein
MNAVTKERVSERTEAENRRLELQELDDKIARNVKLSDLAAAEGNISDASYYQTFVHIYASGREAMIRRHEQCAEQEKIRASLPPVPAVTNDIPFSEMTYNHRHALHMDEAARKIRARLDGSGMEGKYSAELSIMHSFIQFRDDAIKKDLGWVLRDGVYQPPRLPAIRLSFFKRLFG